MPLTNRVDSDRVVRALTALREWDGLGRLDERVRRLANPPSVFHLLRRVIRDEGVHSDMIAWLLDPKGWHGLRDAFTHRFVTTVLEEAQRLGACEACARMGSSPLTVEFVRREFSTGQGPIDIFVRLATSAGAVALGIENKIDSPEGTSQLVRYATGLKTQFPHDTVLLVFLTPGAMKPLGVPPVPVVPMGYDTVAALLQASLSSAETHLVHTAGYQIADQYLHSIRTVLMSIGDPQLDALCRELYERHRLAWQTVRRRLPSDRDELNAALGEAAVARFAGAFGGSWQHSIRRDSYARIFRPAWRAFGVGQDEPILGVTGPTDWTFARVHLRLVSDPPDADDGVQHRYQVKLKVDTRFAGDRRADVLLALDQVKGIATRANDEQFTISIKSRSGLPSVVEKPDTVLDWMLGVHGLRAVIEALDALLP